MTWKSVWLWIKTHWKWILLAIGVAIVLIFVIWFWRRGVKLQQLKAAVRFSKVEGDVKYLEGKKELLTKAIAKTEGKDIVVNSKLTEIDENLGALKKTIIAEKARVKGMNEDEVLEELRKAGYN